MSKRFHSMIPAPDRSLVDRLEAMIIEVVDGLDIGRDCSALVAAINELSGSHDYTEETFHRLYSWTSERQFAKLAAMGPPRGISDMTVEEVSELLSVVCKAKEPNATYFLGILEKSFPALAISDLIYGSQEKWAVEELASEILRRASQEKPICL